MKKFAVILSGCGVFDGAEIHEAVLTLLAIDRAGAHYQCFAPDILQHHVVNHLTGAEMHEQRNVLAEAARIARGEIKPLSLFHAEEYDALVFPGGFGAAKNLCDWAVSGDNCSINPEVESAVKAMYKLSKPIGAMCISPVILAGIFKGTNLTTGNDTASRKFIETKGNQYTQTANGEVIVDGLRKLVTTPCYMLDATISMIAEGTENLVKEMLLLMDH
jgi:enhancing lycopene biosynthesis protein 2